MNIYPIYKKKITRYKKHLKRAVDSLDPHSMHQLRVDIKNIHALFILMESADSNHFKSAEFYKYFKPVFKNSGIIRQSQINIFLFNEIEKKPELVFAYEYFLFEKDRKAISFMSDFKLNKYRKILKKVKGHLKKSCSKISEGEFGVGLLNAISAELDKVKLLFGKPGKPEAYHAIRKHLKRLLFLLPVLNKSTPSVNTLNLAVELKKVENAIGEWHDQLVFTDSLRQFMESKKEILEPETLDTLKLHLSGENEKLTRLASAF